MVLSEKPGEIIIATSLNGERKRKTLGKDEQVLGLEKIHLGRRGLQPHCTGN